MNQTPEFLAAVERLEHLSDTLGDEHPQTAAAFDRVVQLAPPEIRAVMASKAREMGLMPDTPDGYLSNGEPVYNLHSVAKNLGMTDEDAHMALQAFMAERAAQGLDCQLVDPADVHIIQ